MAQTRYRPAAAVARDLLALAAPKARRPRKARDPVRNVRPAPTAEVDETPQDAPRAASITLPPATVTGGLTDEDVGLKRDDIAQVKAERFILAAITYQARRRAA